MTRKYATASRNPGELSASEAADRLGVHTRTIHEWAKEAISGNERRLPREAVRRDVCGRYWLDGETVERLPATFTLSDFI